MRLNALVEQLGLTVCCGENLLERTVSGGYAGDVLSDVIANAAAGNIWVTMHGHVNIVAVSVLKELSAVIVIRRHTLSEDTLRRAREKNVPILTSDRSAFETVEQLSSAGIHGSNH